MATIIAFHKGNNKCFLTRDRNYNITSIVLFYDHKKISFGEQFFFKNIDDNQMITQCTKKGKEIYKVKSRGTKFEMPLALLNKFISSTKNVIDTCKEKYLERLNIKKKHPGQVFSLKTNEWEDISIYIMKCLIAPFFRSLACTIFADGIDCYAICEVTPELYKHYLDLDEKNKIETFDEAYSWLEEDQIGVISDILQYDFVPTRILDEAKKYRVQLDAKCAEILQIYFENKDLTIREILQDLLDIDIKLFPPIHCKRCTYMFDNTNKLV